MPSPIPITRLLPKDFGLEFGACSSPLTKTASGSTLRVPVNTFHGKIAHRLWSSVIHWRELQALEPIGSGGFGMVFKGTYFGETVAVKKVRCVKNKLASRQSFWAELNAAHLHHQNIVRVIAATTCTPAHLNTKDNIGTIVMEFAGALNLHQVIYGLAAPLPMDKCVKYSIDIARALQHLHAHVTVHLDLKPANVLVSQQGVCKLADFGCSFKLSSKSDTVVTHLSEIGGTFTHRAPELLKGEEVTTRVDIYSFGITMWQLLTRESPYEGDRQCILYAVVAYNLRPSITRDVFIQSSSGKTCQKLISRCWDSDPNIRPTADQLVNELSLILL
ncbi:proto-oncogene serine/threonine-protein kinase mos [Rhinichthys klamathensis goyatoka]|uniref:proto-oncogene serine/threonine-protein kinase mos n=1 Tax=Rhinichthys klamathensis goyatoka TaxID=3034132 RepID=UPI0024B624E9|nr:proto-oncogene serine/threonine-protein kinase mos [Rhinichthys klamathensis goyatoka]